MIDIYFIEFYIKIKYSQRLEEYLELISRLPQTGEKIHFQRED